MLIKNKILYKSIIIISIIVAIYIINEKINNKIIYFPIKIISIESKLVNSNKEEIFYITKNYLKTKSFFTMDIDDLKNKIETIDWVRIVNIKRSYPNEVKIFITEHRPIAIWNNEYYLNEFGKVFSAKKIGKNFPLIVSKSNRNDILYEYFSFFVKEISNNKLNIKIKKIEENDIRSLSISLLSGITIIVGSRDIKKKINIFFKAYKTLNSSDLKKIRYIDMRYSNGFSIGWK